MISSWIACVVLIGVQAPEPSPPGPAPKPGAIAASAADSELERALASARASVQAAKDAEKAKNPAAARDAIKQGEAELARATDAERDARCVDVYWELGSLARRVGDLKSARTCLTKVRDYREKALPPEHPDLQVARQSLAIALAESGDAAHARELFEMVLRVREKTLAEDDPDLQTARGNVALAMASSGDLRGARELQEKVLAARERTLPSDHLEVQKARGNLALTAQKLGDLARARELEEKVLAVFERTLPPDHVDLQRARYNLGGTLDSMGDLAGARALFETALASLEKTMPPTSPDLQRVRGNLAQLKSSMDDLVGARALLEQVVSVFEKTRPPEDADLLLARGHLAFVLRRMGELEAARSIEESVLASNEKALPPDDPAVTAAQALLAGTLFRMGELDRARELLEASLASRTKALSPDHIDVQWLRASLAAVLRQTGDVARARALDESVLAVYERTLPPDHPYVVQAYADVGWDAALAHDVPGESIALGRLVDAMRRELHAWQALSTRELRDETAGQSEQISLVLSFAPLVADRARVERAAFEWIESVRALPMAGASASEHACPTCAALRERTAVLRREVGDLVAGLRSANESARPGADAIAEAVRKRDVAEAEYLHARIEAGSGPVDVDVETLARALPPDACAVGYRRYIRFDASTKPSSSPSMLAFVVRAAPSVAAHAGGVASQPDGGASHSDAGASHGEASASRTPAYTLTRVELGPVAPIEDAVSRWRAAAGVPVDSHGPSGADAHRAEAEAGARLRAVVLDPVRAAASGATTLFVCADDCLHLVPLDALPDGEGVVVGDHVSVRLAASFAALIHPLVVPSGAESFVALGDVDFDAGIAAVPTRTAAASPPVSGAPGSERHTAFEPLRETEREVGEATVLFERTFRAKPIVLSREAATKSALLRAAPGARWVHIATHGYFADRRESSDDSGRSLDDAWRHLSVDETTRGMAPMSLCGLALAGANRGRDALGHVDGIVTAEEIAGMDLSQCELVVLSACETNVGVRRAGESLESLQTALHEAGARAAITSLWRVDDQSARELMVDFYRRVWVDKKPKPQALWEAKRALRAARAPTKAWAGWVLTGE